MTITEEIELLKEYDKNDEIGECVYSILEAAESCYPYYKQYARIMLELAKTVIVDQLVNDVFDEPDNYSKEFLNLVDFK